MKAIIAVVLVISSFSLMANDTVNNSTIAISGDFAARPVSKAEKLKQLRRKLEKQNELLVRKQIEQMRFRQEIELTKKIQKAFNENMKALEQMN